MDYINPSFENICRTCLCSLQISEKQKNSVFSEDIKEKIVNLTSFQLYENDGLPNFICTKCMELLDLAYSFKRQIETSEEKLREQLKTEHLPEPTYDDDSVDSSSLNEIPKLEPIEMMEEYEDYKFDVTSNKVDHKSPAEPAEHAEHEPMLIKVPYEAIYQQFLKWREEKQENPCSEEALLTYFFDLATNLKMDCMTLRAIYSMLKSELSANHNIDIQHYSKLHAFLKEQNDKKRKVFTQEQLETFLFEASDVKYLGMKVVMLFGVYGGCRFEELINLKTDDIQDLGSVLFVKISGIDTSIKRTFTIEGEKFVSIYRRYMTARQKMKTRRFYLKYSNGKCSSRVLGINKMRLVPKEVAIYLKLPDWKEYSGHSLRHTAASLYTFIYC